MLREAEQELVRAAAGGDGSEPEVIILTIMLHNDIDSESSDARQHLGYTEKGTGVSFSDRNVIEHLRKGGLAAREGQLRVGDTVLAVDGKPLSGERVGAALNTRRKKQYELRIARRAGEGAGGGVKVQGEHEGWLQFLRAKDGDKVSYLEWPRKAWAVLDSRGNLSLYDSKRSMRPLRVYGLKGGQVKTPVTRLRGEELYQPPVIAAFISHLKFPATLSWQAGEVDHDLVLGE